MGRAKKKVTDDGSSSYSVVRMPGFKMDLHKQQQSLIYSDLNAARQKLQEENQMLRDELAEAKMIIRLLKMKLEEQDAAAAKIKPPTTNAVNSKDSTVKGGVPANYAKAVDRSKKKRYLFKQKTPTRREAFLNPRPPGARAFIARRRSLSPQQQQLPHQQHSPQISPRSTFSPIIGNDNGKDVDDNVNYLPQQMSASSCSQSRIEEVVEQLGTTTLGP